MGNIIAAIIFALVIGLVILYIIRQKKKGVRCIGCPQAGKCSSAKTNEETGETLGCSGCNGGCEGCKPNK